MANIVPKIVTTHKSLRFRRTEHVLIVEAVLNSDNEVMIAGRIVGSKSPRPTVLTNL